MYVCLHATRPPITIDDIHVAARRCNAGCHLMCRLAPALIYSYTTQMRATKNRCIKGHRPLQKRTIGAPTHATRGVSGSSRTSSNEGCLQISHFQLPVPMLPCTLRFHISRLLYEFRNWLKKMSNWKNKEEKF